MSNLVTDLLRELKDGHMTDTTIVCDDGSKFEVHSFILSARSEVFKNMFKTNMDEKKTGIVKIRDFGSDVVEEFVQFLYSDEVKEDSPNLVSLLTIGHLNQIQILVNICADILSTSINNDNIIQLAQLADKYDVDVLAEKCTDILADENLPRDQMELLTPGLVFEIMMKRSKTNNKKSQLVSSDASKVHHHLNFYESIGNPFVQRVGAQLATNIKSSKALKLVGVGFLTGEYNGEVDVNIRRRGDEMNVMTMSGNFRSDISAAPAVINLPTPLDIEKDVTYVVIVIFKTDHFIGFKGTGEKQSVSIITGTEENVTVTNNYPSQIPILYVYA